MSRLESLYSIHLYYEVGILYTRRESTPESWCVRKIRISECGRGGPEEEEEAEEPEPEERGLDAGGAERAETTAVAYGEV